MASSSTARGRREAAEETKLLSGDVRYQAVALIRLELRAQALRVLESIPIKTLGIADLLPLTERLIEAGGASAAVRRLRPRVAQRTQGARSDLAACLPAPSQDLDPGGS